MSGNQVIIIVLVILFTLLLRDLPYFNVVIIGKMWMIYLLLFLVILTSRVGVKLTAVTFVIVFLLGVALLLTLSNLKFFAEIVGIILYFCMWIVMLAKMWSYIQEKS